MHERAYAHVYEYVCMQARTYINLVQQTAHNGASLPCHYIFEKQASKRAISAAVAESISCSGNSSASNLLGVSS